MDKSVNLKNSSLIWLSLSLVALIAFSAIFYFNYPYPNSNASFFGFVKLFFREILILLVFIGIIMLMLITKIREIIKIKREKNA